MKTPILKLLQYLAIALFGIIAIFVTGMIIGEQPAHALPEYADRTGEACSACHVNPGGGGPRTLRGLLWVAEGRPDAIPELGDILLAPGVTAGIELYDAACANCHGFNGEGLFGAALALSGLNEEKISDTILRGRERSGMPGFSGQLTDDQLETLSAYVFGIASGRIEPAPLSYLLPRAKFTCDFQPLEIKCGGN